MGWNLTAGKDKSSLGWGRTALSLVGSRPKLSGWVESLPARRVRPSRDRALVALALFVFLLTAASGVWAAYDRAAAWSKFGWIAGAVLLSAGLAILPPRALWRAAWALCGLAGLLAAYFLLVNNWQSHPVKIQLINRVALAWMDFRPHLPKALPNLDADLTSAVLAVLAPLVFALGLRAWRQGRSRSLLAAVLCGGLVGLALLLSAERGPWLGLLGAAGLGAGWAFSGWAQRRSSGSRTFRVGLMGLLLGLALAGGWLVANRSPDGLNTLANRLPGPAEANGRERLWSNTLDLVQDYPFTGGGLRSFPGLYSQYILLIPYQYLDNSHNLFLEVALEQGWFAFAALVVLLLGSLLVLARPILAQQPDPWAELRGALLAGLVVLGLHGMIEDVLYVSWDTLFLFLIPGLVLALPAPALPAPVIPSSPSAARKKIRLALGVGAALLLSVAILGWRPLVGAWYANLGAVEMARVQLADFPSGKWRVGQALDPSGRLEAGFRRAVRIDPYQRSAHYHLGMIASSRQDFQTAVSELELAYRLDGANPSLSHRGIRKALAFAYLWAGQEHLALPLLATLPEASGELRAYTGWWTYQGRTDLASAARQALSRLDGAG